MPRPAATVALRLAVPEGAAQLASRIADALVAALRDGSLAPGDTLPSTRALAQSLGVSRGPVVAAFDELAAAGFVLARPGSGTVVAPGAGEAARAGATGHVAPEPGPRAPSTAATPVVHATSRAHGGEQSAAGVRWDLRPGRPDTTLIDPRAWRQAWRHAGSVIPGNDADTLPRHDDLRHGLAAHLRRTRGVVTEPEGIVIAPGVNALLPALVAAVGARSWAVEDPGYAEATTALQQAGVRLHTVPVDDAGLDPALIPSGTGALYTTPAHQYPVGARMPVARRVALLDWARRTGGIVVEDDYDGEFRYDVAPMPALRSLPGATDHVVYVGTASKLWTPTLRVAWVVPPAHLQGPLERELASRGLGVAETVGLALARLLDSGAWSAHHARCSRTYAARRAAFVTALREELPGVELLGIDAGLHLVLRLGDDVDDHAVVAALREAAMLANPLSAYAAQVPVSGLVLCYAVLPETRAREAARVVAAAVGRVRGDTNAQALTGAGAAAIPRRASGSLR